MDHMHWQDSLFENLAQIGEDGQAAAAFLRARKTKVNFHRARPNVGAFWTGFGNICLNSRRYSYESTLTDPYLLSLILHEARHLRQGLAVALSVYGELEAWQLQFRAYQLLAGKTPGNSISELLSLPMNWDRTALRRARDLMQTYAGRGYRVDLLPLYPLREEILFWLGISPQKKTGSDRRA